MTDGNSSKAQRQLWNDAARMQIRVIAALVRREARAHSGELRIGYLWAVIEPVLHLVAYAVLFTYIFRRHAPLGGNLILFMLTGLMTYFLFSKLATRLGSAIDGNRALLNLPPVKPFDVLIARALLEAATYVFVGFILLTCLSISGAKDIAPHDPVRVAAAVSGTIVLGLGVGIINSIVRVFIPNWMTIFGLLLSPSFLLSGIWFLPSQIPAPYRDYLLYNPLMHYIMWVRSGFYLNYEPSDLDRSYAVWWSVSAIVLALTLLQVARRKLLEPV